MAKSAVLRCVDETCRRIMHNDLPFGGKVVVLLGDFRQTCPVIRFGTRRQIVGASIRSSALWPHFVVRRLTKPIRNAEDLPFELVQVHVVYRVLCIGRRCECDEAKTFMFSI